MTDDTKYAAWKSKGLDGLDMYRLLKNEDLSWTDSIRILRATYGLSLGEAKEITIIVDTEFDTLSDYQDSVIAPLLEVLEEEAGG